MRPSLDRSFGSVATRDETQEPPMPVQLTDRARRQQTLFTAGADQVEGRATPPSGGAGGEGQAEGVGALAEPRLGEALPGGVVEQEPPLLAGPDGVGLDAARALHLEQQAAGP